MSLGKLLFSFEGRINRAKFWLAVLIYVVASIVTYAAMLAMPTLEAAAALRTIVGLVTFVLGIFVAIKRLHDRSRSGWLLLFFYVAPWVLFAIGFALWLMGAAGELSGGVGLGFLFFAVGLAISLWAFVELGCLRGTVGPNRYGPDPLAPETARAPR